MQTKSDASNTTDRPAKSARLGSNSSRANARCKGVHHTTPSDAKNAQNHTTSFKEDAWLITAWIQSMDNVLYAITSIVSRMEDASDR